MNKYAYHQTMKWMRMSFLSLDNISFLLKTTTIFILYFFFVAFCSERVYSIYCIYSVAHISVVSNWNGWVVYTSETTIIYCSINFRQAMMMIFFVQPFIFHSLCVDIFSFSTIFAAPIIENSRWIFHFPNALYLICKIECLIVLTHCLWLTLLQPHMNKSNRRAIHCIRNISMKCISIHNR